MRRKYKRPISYPYQVELEPSLLVASASMPWEKAPDRRPEKQYFCPFLKDEMQPSMEYYCAKYTKHMNEWAAAIEYYAANHIPDVIHTGGDDCKDRECPVYKLWKQYQELLKKQKSNEK